MECKHNAYIDTAQGRKCLLCGKIIPEEKPEEEPKKAKKKGAKA